MGGTTAQAQVDKKPYKNQTAGWLGVVQLDHLGAQVGVSIEPYGVIYLSDEEAILTSRAPKDPKDNPFVAKPYMFQDETGKQVQQDMVPLILITDDREVPNQDRFVPGRDESDAIPPEVNLHAVAAGHRETEAALARDDDREVPTEAAEPVLVPSSGAAVPPSQARAGSPDGSAPAAPEEDQRASWTDNPERTEEPQPGALGGSDEPAPKPPEGDEAKEGSPTSERQQAPMPQPIQRAQSSVESAAPEEHAAHIASGEETGAAETPVGDPPQGEFAAHEEVGSPDAPTQSAS